MQLRPVNGALKPNSTRGWRAAETGAQKLRIRFDTPRALNLIQSRLRRVGMRAGSGVRLTVVKQRRLHFRTADQTNADHHDWVGPKKLHNPPQAGHWRD